MFAHSEKPESAEKPELPEPPFKIPKFKITLRHDTSGVASPKLHFWDGATIPTVYTVGYVVFRPSGYASK